MDIDIIRSVCLGCGVCVGICPEGFELDENRIAVVKGAPPQSARGLAAEAAGRCPAGAIRMADGFNGR